MKGIKALEHIQVDRRIYESLRLKADTFKKICTPLEYEQLVQDADAAFKMMKLREEQVRETLQDMKPLHIKVITYKYFDGLTGSEIASILNYSSDYIHRLLRTSAIKEFEEKWI